MNTPTASVPLRRPLLAAAIVVAVAGFLSPSVFAATTISQGYMSSKTLAQGAIVSLDDKQSDNVSATTFANVENMLGVVVNSEESALSLSNGQASQLQIATSGIIPVLVSDVNGAIEQGDQITASPIEGVGMKATANARVIGTAQGAPEGTMQSSYKDTDGSERKITLGQADVLVNVAYFYRQPEKTLIPTAIQNVANAIGGRKVSSLPIIIASAIFLIALIIVSSIIYSMIRSSIISVGRNPMSQSAVYRDVIQLSVLVLAILAVAVISIYIVLTRF